MASPCRARPPTGRREILRGPILLAPFCRPLCRVAGRDAQGQGFRISLEIGHDRVYEPYALDALGAATDRKNRGEIRVYLGEPELLQAVSYGS